MTRRWVYVPDSETALASLAGLLTLLMLGVMGGPFQILLHPAYLTAGTLAIGLLFAASGQGWPLKLLGAAALVVAVAGVIVVADLGMFRPWPWETF
jgi:hypothetical protein